MFKLRYNLNNIKFILFLISKKWIYLERNTLHGEYGPSQRASLAAKFTLFKVNEPVSACSVAQLWPTLCDPTDCGLPGSSVHGILQARILEGGCHALPQEFFPTRG